METKAMVFKWTRELSHEGITTSSLYFSELDKSSYYVQRIVRPHYVAIISNYEAINKFSLATSTFDMSFAVWLVLFIYKGKGSDYCQNPPGNIFHLRYGSEMLVRCGTENILREWYSLDGNQTEIDDLATWSLEKGITKLASDSIYDRRYDLRGLVMRAVLVKDSTFVEIENGKLEGIFGRIFQELCVTLNFSFSIVSTVNEYGRWNQKENTWTGAVGEIYAGRADIAIADISMTSERLDAVDFTFPLLLSKNNLYIREPEIFAIKWSSYFLTFTRPIWISILGIFIIASILLIFLKIENGTDRNLGLLLSDNFIEIWGIFCQQGLTEFPYRSSLRIAYFSVCLMAAILSAAYSAALISFLASVFRILPFHSLEDFVEKGTYQFSVFRGTADYDMFAHSRNPVLRKLMKLMIAEEELTSNVLEGFKKICQNRKLALYSSAEVHKTVDLKIPCNVVSIEAGRVDCLSMILTKHNQFTNLINFHVEKFINNGMMNRLKDMSFKKKYNEVIRHKPVRITSVISLIFFVQIGIILSTCILIIEKIVFSHKMKKKTLMMDRILLKKFLKLHEKQKKKMEMTTMLSKWTRALSREGFSTTNLYFSELHRSSYYMGRILRPHYIAIISNHNAINEFSLVTSTFNMSYPVWLVIFFYEGHGLDYCHNPPGNIFHLRFNSEMLVRCGTENILREWYSLDTNQTDIDYLGTWNSDEGIVQKVSGSLYERRKDLKCSIIRVILVKESPFANLNEDNELDGIFGILFEELSAALNFSYIISEIDRYGNLSETENSWTRALNEIVSGRADISLADFSLTSDRLGQFDFSLPIILGENNLYFREPENFTIKWSSYFRIFSYFIWISIIGILIAASILLVFLKINNGNDRKIGLLFSDTFFEILGIFCQQGLTDFPDSYSLRIAYFSIFILAVVLSAAYSAILICFLTSTTRTLPFRSLQAFADDGTYRISCFRDSTKYHSFASSENPLAKKIMKLMVEEEKLPINLMDGFREICDNHKLAIYTYYDVKRDMFVKIPCNVNYVKTGLLENLAFILSKDYPFTDVINAQSSYYVGRILRPLYVSVISNYEAINEFSLATSTFNMSFAVWLVLFIYKGKGSDYCLNPPGNIFHLRFNSEMLVLCGKENIIREWYSLDTNETDIKYLATWNSKEGIVKRVQKPLYKRRIDLKGLVMNTAIVKDSTFLNVIDGELGGIFGRIFTELCTILNFTLNVVSIADDYGIYDPEKDTWSGAIGEIYSGRADISISDFTMTNLKFNTMVQTWARLLSRDKISFINIPFLNMSNTSWYLYKIRKPLFVVILIDDQSVTEFSKASRIFNMSFPAWYVIFLPGNYHQNYCQERSKNLFNIRFNTEMLVTCPPDSVIREWYSLRDNKTETFDLAKLKPDGAFKFLTNLTMYHRRKNMDGLELRTVIVEDSPYIEVEKNGSLRGLFGDVITELGQAANFTLNIVEFVKEYGRWDDDNQIWTGAVGEIVAGRADIAIGEFSLTNSRLDVVDYILPVLVNHMYFYIKNPLYDNVKWTGYFKVFDLKIWIFIIVIILTAPSLVSVLKMNDIQERNIYRIISMVLENYLEFWGIFCQQGLDGFSYRLSLRLAYFSTFLSAFVVFTAYSGTLVSFITNRIHSSPFRTLEELVEDGTYQLAVYRGASDYDMFAYANDSISKKIMKIMIKENELPTTAFEGLLLVCKSKQRVTFYTSVDIRLSVRNHSLCNLIKISGERIITLSMILTKNNPFIDLINHQTSSVFLFYLRTTSEDLEFSRLIHRWIRELSREGFMALGTEISNMREISYYENRIVRPLFVVFLSDNESIIKFSKSTRNFDMSSAYWYVIFLPGYNQKDYCPIPKGNPFNLLFNTEMLVSCPKDKIMREWYSLRTNQTKVFELAEWESDGTLMLLNELSLYERRNSLEGLVIPAVIVLSNPFINMDENGKLTGSCGKILLELTRLVNFSFVIVNESSSNGRWNAKYNSWNGAVGELVANRAQFTISFVSMSKSRSEVVDFTLPFILSSTSMYIKEPDVSSVEWSNYFRTFNYKIWISLIILILTTPILLAFMKIIAKQRKFVSLFSDSYLQIWGIFCQQGLDEFPQRFSLRLAYFSLFLSAFIVSSAYSASLISFLTNVISRLPFLSMEEFVKDGTYTLISPKDSLEYDVFANSKHPLAKKIMSFMKPEEKLPLTHLEGFFQVCNERNVAMYVSTEVRNVLDPEIPCNIARINLGHIDSVSLMWSKKNQFLSLINHHSLEVSNQNLRKYYMSDKKFTFLFGCDDDFEKKKLNLIGNHINEFCNGSIDMQMSTMIHTWSRELSRQGILSISINFTDLAMDNKKYNPTSKPLFVILLSTWENFEEFSKVSKELEVSLFVWFVLFMETPGNPMEEFCQNPIGNFFNLNFDTEMLILCYNETILKEWYSVKGNNTITSNFATWKPGNYFSAISNESLYGRRSNLFGTVLRIGTVKDSSFIGTKNNKLTKLLGVIVMELSKTINFTVDVLEPVDAYGSWDKENETWNGVIGQLVSGEIDLGVAEFTVTTNRMEAVDFTLPFLLSRNRLYMKENPGSVINWSAYFKTFSPGIWAIIILMITTTPILLTIIKTKSFYISGSVLSENYIHVWGIYCQQGISEFPTDSSLRLAFISIFVSAIIVSAAYSASLISFLTVTTNSLPFSTLNDFANDGSYNLIVFGNSADYDLFANSKDEVIIQMMSLMKPKNKLPTTLSQGFHEGTDEFNAWSLWATTQDSIRVQKYE
ncbi:hypothetical protein M0804_001587 [Polistes exclamans]|nr:hypothetical protein M0804_001587 [Polistes exclamans]